MPHIAFANMGCLPHIVFCNMGYAPYCLCQYGLSTPYCILQLGVTPHCPYQYGVSTPYCILQNGVCPILPLSILVVYPILYFAIWGVPHIAFVNMGCLPHIKKGKKKRSKRFARSVALGPSNKQAGTNLKSPHAVPMSHVMNGSTKFEFLQLDSPILVRV